jgi:tetraacyldisaccharide 4'-kinase
MLQPAGWVYGQTTARRMRQSGEQVSAPTICVGNFVAGGAGKTPAALALARILIGEGRRVAFLSRGFGGAERVEPLLVDPNVHNAAIVGDEPLLLARLAPCWVGPDRARSARRAIEAGANALVLDDGLQNPGLAKDLAFAVVDGETGFGNGLCVPAGPLRAPLAAQLPLVRALIVLGAEDAAAARIAALAPGKPLIRASLEPDALAAAPLIGREVVAFAGIARPEKFYATLRRVGAQIVMTRDFPDHHPYTPHEIEALIGEAGRRSALLATTEKDLVRLGARHARAVMTLPVTLRFQEPKVVRRMLRQALGG